MKKPPTDMSRSIMTLLSLAVALVLLALSLPMFGARVMMLGANEIRDDLLEEKPVSRQDLDRLVINRQRVLPFYQGADLCNDLALAFFAMGQKDGFVSPEGHKHLLEVIKWQRYALDRSPADTYGWARLAYAYLLIEGAKSQHAALAITHSMEAGPFEPRLMFSRLNTAMMLFDELSDEAKGRALKLLQEAWRVNPAAVRVAAKDGHFEARLAGLPAIHLP